MLVEFLDDNDLESTGAPVVRKSLMNSVHRQKIGNGKISEAESKFSEVAGVSQTANDSSPCESLIESIDIVSAEPKYGDVTAEPEEGSNFYVCSVHVQYILRTTAFVLWDMCICVYHDYIYY